LFCAIARVDRRSRSVSPHLKSRRRRHRARPRRVVRWMYNAAQLRLGVRRHLDGHVEMKPKRIIVVVPLLPGWIGRELRSPSFDPLRPPFQRLAHRPFVFPRIRLMDGELDTLLAMLTELIHAHCQKKNTTRAVAHTCLSSDSDGTPPWAHLVKSQRR
jgi:hypothetical protein